MNYNHKQQKRNSILNYLELSIAEERDQLMHHHNGFIEHILLALIFSIGTTTSFFVYQEWYIPQVISSYTQATYADFHQTAESIKTLSPSIIGSNLSAENMVLGDSSDNIDEETVFASGEMEVLKKSETNILSELIYEIISNRSRLNLESSIDSRLNEFYIISKEYTDEYYNTIALLEKVEEFNTKNFHLFDNSNFFNAKSIDDLIFSVGKLNEEILIIKSLRTELSEKQTDDQDLQSTIASSIAFSDNYLYSIERFVDLLENLPEKIKQGNAVEIELLIMDIEKELSTLKAYDFTSIQHNINQSILSKQQDLVKKYEKVLSISGEIELIYSDIKNQK